MANLYIILSAVLAVQVCIYAAPNAEKHIPNANEENVQGLGQAGPLLDDGYKLSVAAKINDDETLQGQRQKRFYDYFDYFFPFRPYNPNFTKRDDSQNTGVYGTQDYMSQILRRIQFILNYTRQQVQTPHVPHPVQFIPLFYIPHQGCGCTPAETPTNGDESSTARPTQDTTATPPAAASTTQAIIPANEPRPSPTDDTNKTTPDLSSRSPEVDDDDDEGDGSRPISFVPVKPKTPLSRPAPPVEHGSVQASRRENEFPTTTTRPVITGLPPQPHLPTNTIPTLCDSAVLSCCHRAEATYACFKAQGCPNPSYPDDPCNEEGILKVIRKFQYYYANRRG